VPTGYLSGLTRGVVVLVHSGRLSRLRHHRQDVATADHRAGADGHASRRRAPVSNRRESPVLVVPADDRDVGIEQLADRHRDGFEDLGRGRVAGDERRDVPQSGLLVRE
jgi:hypothetical protein